MSSPNTIPNNEAKRACLDTWKGDIPSKDAKACMGYGGIRILDDSVDILDMLRAYMQRALEESCGQCFPCRSGLKRISARLEAICHGSTDSPHTDNIDYLKHLAQTVKSSARCDIGQTTPIPLLDVLENCPDILKPRKVDRQEYASYVTAPCTNACPGHVDIPEYIEKIRLRQYESSFKSIMQRCPMPGTIGRVCERPCEAACKRGLNGSPIAIRHLKRFAFDKKYPEKIIPTNNTLDKQKIAVIGAGPAGLSCAYYLALEGFQVTIFERQEYAGGMAKYGIPDYRLPPPILAQEVERVTALGCEIRYGIDIGKDITIKELENQGFAVVFVGAGAPNAPGMRIEGEDENPINYVSGIHYLAEATKGNQIIHGKRVVVVGGGNVAMDCVRTALRHGFKDVQILYRRTENEMPADKAEIHEAKLEGVLFNFLMAPTKLIVEDGKVKGITCQKMKLGEPDASGRRRPEAIEGAIVDFEADVVIHAIGQKTAIPQVLSGLEGGLNKWNDLDAHAISGKVQGFEELFGGGDCVTGPSSLIEALAAGRRAARHISTQLTDKNTNLQEADCVEQALMRQNILDPSEALPCTDFTEPMPIHMLDMDIRLQGFGEVEMNSTDFEAEREASRCLRCFRILMLAN